MNNSDQAPQGVTPRYDKQPPGVPSIIDMHVGRRLRQRRSLLGISQERLGESVGLTFQQIQKYERGANRIAASRLYQFSVILGISIAYFFEDMPQSPETMGNTNPIGLGDGKQVDYDPDTMARRETLELVRAYYQIASPDVRRRILELARSLGLSPET